MIRSVYLFRNGNVAVFDVSGEQLPHLQGRCADVAGAIGRAAPKEGVLWFFQGTLKEIMQVDREDWLSLAEGMARRLQERGTGESVPLCDPSAED